MNAIFTIRGKTIETDRLVLRPFSPSDLDDFYAYASVEGVGERAGWRHHENKEKSQEILDKFIQEDKTFALCLKENQKVIGSLGVERYGLENALTEFIPYKGRELGFVLSKEYWGQGLMTDAVRAVMEYLFETLNFDFLLCGHYAFNEASKRVQEKCGFKPYRKLVFDTRMGTKEPGILSLATHPAKNISFHFSHPETLIYEK